ncbi:MAG: PAS domain-containing protein [Gammaproteobacteria bacterium]|nr:PAS domain-containing protein [Gammaproteobacteria bacterium]
MNSFEINQELVETVNSLKKRLCDAENKIASFKIIFDELPGSVYLKDKEGKHLLLNKHSRDQLRNLHGILEDTIGKTDLEIFPREWAEKFQKNDKEVLIHGKTILREEEVELPNGKKLTQLSSKKPLRANNGEIIGLIGTTIDITDKKRAQLEIEKAKKKAEELNQAKSEFIANMNHDLRTPLSGILGIADLALQRLSESDPNR